MREDIGWFGSNYMRLINGNTLVILSWDEYSEILNALPEEKLIEIAARFDIKMTSLPYKKENVINGIFIESEEQP